MAHEPADGSQANPIRYRRAPSHTLSALDPTLEIHACGKLLATSSSLSPDLELNDQHAYHLHLPAGSEHVGMHNDYTKKTGRSLANSPAAPSRQLRRYMGLLYETRSL